MVKLKFTGRVTYNGHGMEEFVPQRTSAYVSQHDLHIGEMTVRETLAFSAVKELDRIMVSHRIMNLIDVFSFYKCSKRSSFT